MIRKKKVITTMILAGFFGLAQAQSSSASDGHVQSATAISRVLGDGRKVETVVLEYDTPISNKSLTNGSFRVEGKEVTRIYANNAPERARQGVNGQYVIIEVKAEVNLNAQPKQPTEAEMEKKRERDRMQGGPGLRAGWSTGGNDEYPGNAVAVQTANIKTVKGKTYKASDAQIASTAERCLVADDFKQEEFVSPYTGQTLPYNIPEAQARHECIVVAPEYPFITVDDNWNYSHHLDATIALLKDLQTRYSIDLKCIYTTGQSMGCMSSIVMMLKEPELFAGVLLVAGKWNPALMGPLDKQNIWIISCEGDVSSNTLQGQAVELWRSQGSRVSEATWDMTLPQAQLSEEANKMRAEGNHLLFTHLTGGNHRATWFVAYGIEGVQDWLFEQHR